jgi:hypothetical protein
VRSSESRMGDFSCFIGGMRLLGGRACCGVTEKRRFPIHHAALTQQACTPQQHADFDRQRARAKQKSFPAVFVGRHFPLTPIPASADACRRTACRFIVLSRHLLHMLSR